MGRSLPSSPGTQAAPSTKAAQTLPEIPTVLSRGQRELFPWHKHDVDDRPEGVVKHGSGSQAGHVSILGEVSTQVAHGHVVHAIP